MAVQITAFILMVTELAKEQEVVREVLRIPGVVEARLLYGEFDVLAKVEVNSMKELDEVITKVRNTRGVVKTTTLISS
ncbi:MAG: Lrp/AsnC ligand binding domain-containing protein [Candidatus Nezhaarchaeales archaeon]